MAAGIFALVAVLAAAWWVRKNLVPPLPDDQVQALVDEYLISDAIGDEPRAIEILRDLGREGVALRMTDDGIKWERR